MRRVRSVGRVQGSRSLLICHNKYSVWALALKAIRLRQWVDCTEQANCPTELLVKLKVLRYAVGHFIVGQRLSSLVGYCYNSWSC